MRQREPEVSLHSYSVPARADSPKARPGPRGCGTRLRRALRQPKALCALRPGQRGRRALAGGSAPRCLQRKLLPPAERVRRLNQTCAWIEQPPRLPRLRKGPLVGHCLEAVLAPRGSRSEADGASSPAPVRLPGDPEGIHRPGHKRGSAPPPRPWSSAEPGIRPNGAAVRPRPGPYALAQRLPAEHLQRFDLPRARRPARLTPDIVRRTRPLPKHGTVRARRGGAGAKGWSTESVGQYLQRVAARFAQRMKQAGPSGSAQGVLSAGPYDFSGSMIWARAALAATLGGPAARRALLLDLAGRLPESESPLDEGTTSRPPEQNPGSDVAAERRRTGTEAPPRSASEAAREGFYPQTGSLPLPEAGLDGGQSLVAPPLAAEIPATLLPPRRPFEAPTPYASATLRHEALGDEADLVQENLDALADKIKLILDEEARRYGIQV